MFLLINGFDNPPKWENGGFGGVFKNKLSLANGNPNSNANSHSTLAAVLSGANSTSGTGFANQASYTTPVTPVGED